MSHELMLGLIGFAFVASATPGPNNIMLLTSGVNFGLRRSLPHMLGIVIGFALMILAVGAGLAQLLAHSPVLHQALRIISIGYMLWLAWAIARSGPVESGEAGNSGHPLTFLQAALFQWVNPKAWAVALTATAAYRIPGDGLLGALLVAAVFGAVSLPSVSLWTGFGVGLRRLLQDPVKVRLFNGAMAVLLILSFLPIILDGEILG